jgi:hypothetical protein
MRLRFLGLTVEYQRAHSGTLRRRKLFFAGSIALWLCCASPVTTRARENPRPNWTSAHAPCAKYDYLRNSVLGNVGVKIDVNGDWADAFRRALRFWNTALAVNFYENNNLSACTIRIVAGGADILNHATVARSQVVEWTNFRGKIAVSERAGNEMSSSELYAAAVHELGHMLGLKHNASRHSVMYFLDIDGTEILDSKDIRDLGAHHKLRPAVIATGFLSIQSVQPEIASRTTARSIDPSVAN